MYARITQLHVLPGKLEDYLVAVDSLRPMMHKQAGFRAILLLRSAETPAKDGDEREIMVTAVSVWDTLEHMRASEKNLFLYQAIARTQAFCKGFPHIREEEVIASEFRGRHVEDATA